MNLPEYRRAIRDAMNKYSNAVVDAAETLHKELTSADEQFFDTDNEPKRADR